MPDPLETPRADTDTLHLYNMATDVSTKLARQRAGSVAKVRVLSILGAKVRPGRSLQTTRGLVLRSLPELQRLEELGLVQCYTPARTHRVFLREGLPEQVQAARQHERVVAGEIYPMDRTFEQIAKGDSKEPEGGWSWKDPSSFTGAQQQLERQMAEARQKGLLPAASGRPLFEAPKDAGPPDFDIPPPRQVTTQPASFTPVVTPLQPPVVLDRQEAREMAELNPDFFGSSEEEPDFLPPPPGISLKRL